MGDSTLVVSNLNGGEISPRAFGRTDIELYHASVAELMNFVPCIQGGVERRSGTRFVATAFDHAKRIRLVPFIVSPTDTHVLELSHFTMRIFRSGGITLTGTFAINSSKDIDAISDEFQVLGSGYRHGDGPFRFTTSGVLPTGILAATDYFILLPQVMTFIDNATHVDVVNNEIRVDGHGLSDRMGPFRFTGSSALPGNLLYDTDYFVITSGLVNPAANWFGLALTPGGAKIDITTVGTGTHTLSPTALYVAAKFRVSTTSGGPVNGITTAGSGLQTIRPVTAAPLIVDIPWNENEVWELDFAQSADIMYLVHPSHKPRRLSRLSATGWLLEEIEFRDGPYLPENLTSVTIALSATTLGALVDVTASQPIFSSKDAGRLFRKSSQAGDANAGLHWGYLRIASVSGVDFSDVDIDQAIISATVDTDPASDQLTEVGHPFSNAEGPIRLRIILGSLPGGLNQGTDYWIISTGPNTFKLAISEANALLGIAVDITFDGTGIFRVTTSVLEIAGHGILDEEGPLTLTTSGALPQGLAGATSYFAKRLSADSLQLSLTKGGAAVAIDSATGGGIHFINGSVAGLTSVVKAIVLESPPNGTASTNWALGLFGPDSARGHPAAVGFAEQRLVTGAAPGSKSRFDMSQAGDLENFAPDDSMDSGRQSDKVSGTPSGGVTDDHLITDASAIPYTIVSQESQQIRFLPGHRQLIVLSNGGIWPVQSSRDLALVSPTDVTARMASNWGSAGVKPIFVEDELIYVSRLGSRLIGARWSPENDGVAVRELSLAADHMLVSGILQLAYAPEPFGTIWMVRGDGLLVSITRHHEQEVNAFARHEIGGFFQGERAKVESVVSIPDLDSGDDRIYLAVRRTINGQDVRYIEYLTPRFELDTETEDAVYLDATLAPFKGVEASFTGIIIGNTILDPVPSTVDFIALGFQIGHIVRMRALGSPFHASIRTIDLVTSTTLRFTVTLGATDLVPRSWVVEQIVTSVSGLGHLEGQSVMVLADGMVQGPFTVTAGAVTLADASNKVLVGLAFTSRLLSLPLQSLATGEGRIELSLVTTRISRMSLLLLRTLALNLGPSTDKLQELPFRTPEDEMDQQLELFTGEYLIDPNEFPISEESSFVLQVDKPLPCNVLRLSARISWGSR